MGLLFTPAEAVPFVKATSPMIDWDFHQFIAGSLNESRNESVHPLERNQRRHAFAAARVTDRTIYFAS